MSTCKKEGTFLYKKWKDPYKTLILILKSTGRSKKLTNGAIFMEKLDDFIIIIIINVKQVFKSINIYLIKHKFIFTFVYNQSKYSSWRKDTNSLLGFKTSPTERLHISNSYYCSWDSELIKLK